MDLEQELKTYQEKLPEMLDRAGQYVVICGDKIVDFFNDYEDALRAGYKKCGVNNAFLVKRIEHEETIHHFTRNIVA